MRQDNNYSGFLLDWPSRSVRVDDLLLCSSLQYVSTIGASKWERFIYKSDTPLRGEDPDILSAPFKYEVICRRSGSRLLILSYNRDIVDHILVQELHKILVPRLRHMSIAVDQLVRIIAEKPTIYSLSFVHAQVPAFGTSLRLVTFHGNDLAEASLFRDHIDLFNVLTCGLRYTIGGREIVKLGGDGTVSFYMARDERVREVERVLTFLRDNDYLSSDILADE
jgi:hypothetical protein